MEGKGNEYAQKQTKIRKRQKENDKGEDCALTCKKKEITERGIE